jgi:hypothetical protein
MRVGDYFQSLAGEVDALCNRVRYLIEDHHWQTDGEWKESVVRQILRRHLPSSAVVGRGFVVASAGVSHQIDVFVTDANKPVLFKDGDFTIVTPDAVIGILEVKTRVDSSILRTVARKLGATMLLIRGHPNPRAFAGVFAFEDGGSTPNAYLNALSNDCHCWDGRINLYRTGVRRALWLQ